MQLRWMESATGIVVILSQPEISEFLIKLKGRGAMPTLSLTICKILSAR